MLLILPLPQHVVVALTRWQLTLSVLLIVCRALLGGTRNALNFTRGTIERVPLPSASLGVLVSFRRFCAALLSITRSALLWTCGG